MITVDTIAERDAIRPQPVLFVYNAGKWDCYMEGDTLPVAPASPLANIIPVSDFRDRFTDTEMAGIVSLAYGGDIMLQMLLLKLQTNTSGINLMSAETIGGVDYLVSKGVLTAVRKDEVLA